MASDQFNKFISNLNQVSTSLSELSTKLSKQIEGFEAILNNLEGKVSVTVKGPSDDLLAFQRSADGVWRLNYSHGSGAGWLSLTSNASVEVKIRSVALFSLLLPAIAKQQTERVAELKQACEAMSRFGEEIGVNLLEGK